MAIPVWYYDAIITFFAVLTAAYIAYVFVCERKRWYELSKPMSYLAAANICFALMGVAWGVVFLGGGRETLARFAPPTFYFLGLIFLFLAGLGFRSFSSKFHE